nr:hypothetical protein GCM10020092_106910 [Actinoplanes digitatis]
MVGAFDNVVAAGNAVAATTRAGLLPTALELLDRACLRAVEDWKHLGLSATAEALLLAQVDTPGEAEPRRGGRARPGLPGRGRAVGRALH